MRSRGARNEAWTRLTPKRRLACITALEQDPRPSGCKKLRGATNTYRIRSGDYRVVYTIEDAELLVLVVRVGHRREVYR